MNDGAAIKRTQPRNPFVPKVPGIQYPLLQQALLHPAYRGVFRLKPTLKMVTSFLLNSQSSLPTGTKQPPSCLATTDFPRMPVATRRGPGPLPPGWQSSSDLTPVP